METITKQSAEAIVAVLQKNEILPKSVKGSSVSDLSDLKNLLVSHNSDSYIEIWTEDWGTDNDIDKDYVDLLKLFEKKSKGSIKFSNLESKNTGGSVHISFSVNGALYDWEFGQVFDHFSEEFEEYFLELQKTLSNNRYIYLSGGDMPEYILLPKDVANLLLGYGISGEAESSSVKLADDILDLIEFARANRLTVLDLSEKSVSQLPKEIGLLTDLEELGLSFNELKEIPDEIGNLTNLKILELHGNKLSSLPLAIKKLQKLEELTLGGNAFKEIPAVVYELIALKRLAFPANKVRFISQDIKKLTNLTKLHCMKNKFSKFPVEVCALENLEELDLSWNGIKIVPDDIGTLSNLTDLYLLGNKVTSISDEIGKLSELWRLILSDNQLESLPITLGDLPHCLRIDIHSNPIYKNENYKKGTKHLLKYLRELGKEL